MLFYILFVCKCVLPPGDNPVAVNKYINFVKCPSLRYGIKLQTSFNTHYFYRCIGHGSFIV